MFGLGLVIGIAVGGLFVTFVALLLDHMQEVEDDLSNK
jgi:uncharacterized membrane-anchored protein YhcB (DUF1043 family)